MITIKKIITPDYISELYFKFLEKIALNEKEPIDLKLPNHIEDKYFNVTVLLIQFISTWSHHERSGHLLTDIEGNVGIETFQRWSESDIHFAAVLLCWNKEIKNREGQNIKYNFKKHIDIRIESMKNVKQIRGNKALFACVDDYDDRIALLRHFYSSSNELLSKGDPTKAYFTDNVLQNVIGFKTSVSSLRNISSDCQAIIYELFENTHYWARTSYNNKKTIYPSIRGLFIKFHRYKEEILKRGISENKGLNNYFLHQAFKPNENGELYFIEFSVFDCGDGFVKRFTEHDSEELAEEKKVEIIKKCLWKGFSSQKGYAEYERGNGLFLLCNLLNNKGFLRIKTDTVELFRDFIEKPFDKEIDLLAKDAKNNFTFIDLFDWSTGKANSSSKNMMTKGSVVSIVYPVEVQAFNPLDISTKQHMLFNE